MSKDKKAIAKSKKAAWAAKQEEQGKKVIGWIIGILIALGVIYLLASFFM